MEYVEDVPIREFLNMVEDKLIDKSEQLQDEIGAADINVMMKPGRTIKEYIKNI